MVKKVAIIGPESTGKSTLSQRLAAHYHTLWVPEYAREYLHKHGTAYTYNTLLHIAKGQLALEDQYLSKLQPSNPPTFQQPSNFPTTLQPSNHPTIQPSNPARSKNPGQASKLLFVDTEMYVMKVWCEFVYQKCHQWIIDQVVSRQYDLYLLCNIDIPWSPDVLREYPDPEPRQQLFRMYHDILVNQSTPWELISGDNEERLQSAIAAINGIL